VWVQANISLRPLGGRGAGVRGSKHASRRRSGVRPCHTHTHSEVRLLSSGFQHPPHPPSLSPGWGEGGENGGGTPPPHFCNSNARAPSGPQDIGTAEGHPVRFPKARMGTLDNRGEGGGRFCENNDQDRVVLGLSPAKYWSIRLLPCAAGEGDHAKHGGGGRKYASLPAFGGTPPAAQGESHRVERP
jgi:hypothetical protein